MRNHLNKKALLIGNGVNRLDTSQSLSWQELLQDLKNHFDIEVDLDNVFKPFPLAFDEMLHRKRGTNDFDDKLKRLKKKIRDSIEQQLIGKRGFNDIHSKFATLGYDNILTTNYDYSLQLSIQNNFLDEKNDLAQNKQERKYSLKRNYYLPINDLRIWHIHGELFDSRKISSNSKYYHEESIMIGYEHYATYLQRIQDNIKGKSGAQKIEHKSLRVRIRDGLESPFWTDIFFTHDLDIVGLGLDFSENHLWWLINFRANKMRKMNSRSDIQYHNTIRFFFPKLNNSNNIDLNIADLGEIIDMRNNIQKSKAIAGVLKAFKVETIPVQCNSYKNFYDEITENYLLH